MGPGELCRWFAFYKLDPWGEERADFRNAMLCAIVANIVSKQPIPIEKFLLRPAEREQTDEEIAAALHQMTTIQNAYHEQNG